MTMNALDKPYSIGSRKLGADCLVHWQADLFINCLRFFDINLQLNCHHTLAWLVLACIMQRCTTLETTPAVLRPSEATKASGKFLSFRNYVTTKTFLGF